MSGSIGGGATRFGGDEASPPVSPSMEGVLPIRGVDGSTGEAIPIASTSGLREAEDPYRADVVRWAAMDVPSIMVEEDLTKLREAYRIPADIELILPDPNERACFPRRGCTALHLNAFVSGMRLPLHPMLRRILRAYDLAPTQVAPNGWSQMVGGMYLWFRHSFGMEMPLHVFQTIYQPRKLPRKKGGEEEVGWYYFSPWGSHKPLVTGCPSSIKQWKESWFWVSGNWQRVFDDPEPDLDVPSVYGIASPLPRCELSQGAVDVLKSIYQADQKSRSYGLILNRHRCLVELGLMASKAEMDQGKRPRPTLARLSKQRPKTLAPGSAEDVEDIPEVEVPLSRKRKAKSTETGTSQPRGSTVDVDTVSGVPPLQRTLAVNPSGEVVLEGPSRPTPGSGDGGPFDSKRRFRELIGAPGVRIPDDVLRNVPFYPSMGAQAVKKYFTPKWEEFSSHRGFGGRAGGQPGFGDKSLGDADEGPGWRLTLKESDSNLLNMTKQLDNANAAQRVAAEALEAANQEKRRLLEEAKSRDEEISGLRKELVDAENWQKGRPRMGRRRSKRDWPMLRQISWQTSTTPRPTLILQTILPGWVIKKF
ncbi:Plus3 domain-containing protein [Abeliophyllum distichum]|uniref:Plus3 domain-containing protein n=1 Tax=Abeliophyllum distichum TaxID=126358 RepID=A0ABD1SAN9_9LAMI